MSKNSKNREREAWAAAGKRSRRLLVAGHAFRRAAKAARKSGEYVLATADGKEAATALLKAAVQWRNEARLYATDHGKPPMDRPPEGPLALGGHRGRGPCQDAVSARGPQLHPGEGLGLGCQGQRRPAPPKQKKRKPEVA